MRRWILVAGVAVAAMLATACSSSGGTSSSSTSGPVTLTIWHNYGTEQNATALKNLAAAFHKLHPNVTVNVVSQPADNYFALLQAAAVSKTGPDLTVMWTGLFTLQYKNFLANLQGKVPASALARIDPDALKWTSNDFNASNGPYVIPLENQFYIGFYNKAAFAKAGVSAVPTDWNQLFAACQKLKAAGYTPMTYGNGGQPLGAEFYPWYDMSYMMIGAYPVALLNLMTVSINIVQLIRLRRRHEIFRILEISPRSEYLRYFLDFEQRGIRRFFPRFEFDSESTDVVVFDATTTNLPCPTMLNQAQRTYHEPAPTDAVRGTRSDHFSCPPAGAFFVVPLCIVWFAYVTTGEQREPGFVFTLIASA